MIYALDRNEDIGYDEYDAKIVRADSEAEARQIANQTTGDEGKIWTDPTRVTCQVITPDGPSGPLLESFRAG